MHGKSSEKKKSIAGSETKEMEILNKHHISLSICVYYVFHSHSTYDYSNQMSCRQWKVRYLGLGTKHMCANIVRFLNTYNICQLNHERYLKVPCPQNEFSYLDE